MPPGRPGLPATPDIPGLRGQRVPLELEGRGLLGLQDRPGLWATLAPRGQRGLWGLDGRSWGDGAGGRSWGYGANGAYGANR